MLISSKYEVLAEIGRGGMGIVYKVQHTSLETESALKILPAHLADDQELVARFHREARVMAQLRHPNIVRVLDVDKAGDLHYFVMEYVEGRSLSEVIAEEGRCSLPETLEIGIQVARALEYAHGRRPQVIHRDIKPSNILIDAETRRAVVTDFGLAKLAGGAESLRTESGKFIGTLRYCAPEQLIGNPHVDVRVDVYALGMVIYEAYAGRSAYVDLERPQVIAGLLQLTGEHPFQFAAESPEEFRRIVKRATAKDREKRYATISDLLRDLERLQSTLPRSGGEPTIGAGARPPALQKAPPTSSRVRARVIAIGTVASVGLALGAGLVVRGRLGSARDGATVAPLEKQAATASPEVVRGAVQTAEDAARKYISVMDFSLGSPDPSFAWMRDAIRDNLNSRLSSSPGCKVFSKEFIDFKAQQMVREGHYQDVKAATMEVAQKLGVTKAVLGSVRADHDSLHIEAHLVDMETGVQEASETVDGQQDDFGKLQATLASKLMARLGVAPPVAEAEPVQSAETGGDLESYRLLMQAEGQASSIEPTPSAPKPRKRDDRRGDARPLGAIGRLVEAAIEGLGAPPAMAVDSEPALDPAESEIRHTLEMYRRACELKDLALLVEVYDKLSPAQIDANRRYFENADNLEVAFDEIDVALGQENAAVSYTRRDHFIDSQTRLPTKVEVRLTKILVKVDGAWKIVSGASRK